MALNKEQSVITIKVSGGNKWLKTDAGMAYSAKNMRYKRAALSMMQLDSIIDELYEISSECSELEWSVSDDETLLDALGGDSDDISEFRFAFSDLSSKCESLQGYLNETGVTEHFDDFFVGISGNHYKMIGYDSFREDYFSLTMLERGLAQSESGKRLMRLTKENLISISGQCFGVALAILDIRHSYGCLKAAFDILKGDRMELLKDIKGIEGAYEESQKEEFRGPATNRLDTMLCNLPDKVWVG